MKRLLAILLTLCVILVAMTVTALAADPVTVELNPGRNTVAMEPGVEYILVPVGDVTGYAMSWTDRAVTVTVTNNRAGTTETISQLPYYFQPATKLTATAAVATNAVFNVEIPAEPMWDGANAFDVQNADAGVLVEYIAAEAGSYILSAAEGETNAYVSLVTSTGSESVDLPYAIDLAEDEGVYFSISTNDMQADEINLVMAKCEHAKLAHVEAVKATCTVDGNWEYWECELCGKIFDDAEGKVENTQGIVDDALGHDTKSDYYPATAATCTEGGNYEYWQCGVCFAYLMKDEAGEYYEVDREDVAIIAHGHSTKSELIEAVPATCTEWGNKEYKICMTCGEYLLADEENQTWEIVEREDILIQPHGHSTKSELIEAKPATCTEWGNKEYKLCMTCGAYLLKADDGISYEEVTREDVLIQAHGHQRPIQIEAKRATCDEVGNIEYYWCNACGAYMLKNEEEQKWDIVTREDVIILPLGHERLEKIEAVAPTATTAGNVEYWWCNACGKYLSEKGPDAVELHFPEDIVVPVVKAETPATGDTTALFALVALVVLGGLGITAVTVMKKRAI